jgi:F-type H+-transporting ATPase subunit delta
MSVIVANRYAQAWIMLLVKNEVLKKSFEDAHLILDTLNQKKLALALKSKVISIQIKKNIVSELFSDRVNTLTMNFLNLIFERKRGALIKEIFEQFLILYRKKNDIYLVCITSATILDPENRTQILIKLQKKYPKIEVLYEEKSNLLGGFIIEVSGQQMDFSLRGQLKKIKKQLTN